MLLFNTLVVSKLHAILSVSAANFYLVYTNFDWLSDFQSIIADNDVMGWPLYLDSFCICRLIINKLIILSMFYMKHFLYDMFDKVICSDVPFMIFQISALCPI